jgi:hypothetical protein
VPCSVGWAILIGCVLVSIVLLRVQARQQFHEDEAAAFANDEWFIAERRKVARPKRTALAPQTCLV